MEVPMPAIFIPVLWVGGAAILLGGGWYVFAHMTHWSFTPPAGGSLLQLEHIFM